MIAFQEGRRLDLICMGRAGIDLNTVEINVPMEETVTYRKTVGGSPANIAAGAAALGLRTGFIGRVADNGMGRYIRNYFENKDIDVSCLIPDKDGGVNGLAVTEIKSPTDCGSVMYRDNVSDLHLSPSDIREDYIASARVLLISGTALSAEPSRAAAFLAAEYAQRNGTVLALDIDYRPFSWRSVDETAIYYSLLCEKCDVIIGNREEFDLLDRFTGDWREGTESVFSQQKESEHSWTGKSGSSREDDRISAERWLRKKGQLIVVKRGNEGSACFTAGGEAIRMGIYPAKEMKKTFGAGDAFAAAFIAGLIRGKDILEALRMGSASASLVVERTDCSEAMPEESEILERMQSFGADYTGLSQRDGMG